MKTCPEKKILNPKTNRCVLKDGKIGKLLLMVVQKDKGLAEKYQKLSKKHNNISIKIVKKDNPLLKKDVKPFEILDTNKREWKGILSSLKGTSLCKYLQEKLPLCENKEGNKYFTLFHGTSLSAIKKILTNGLQPIGGNQSSGYIGFHAARNPQTAIYYMSFKETKCDLPIILQFRIYPEEALHIKCRKDVICRINDFCFKNSNATSILHLNTIYLVQDLNYHHSSKNMKIAKDELQFLLTER